MTDKATTQAVFKKMTLDPEINERAGELMRSRNLSFNEAHRAAKQEVETEQAALHDERTADLRLRGVI